jgi:hypothetical protein
MKPPTSSPWGYIEETTRLADGIYFVSTASHGGIWLSRERQKEIGRKSPFLKSAEWWEEDCDWAIPAYYFQHEIKATGHAVRTKRMVDQARKTILTWHRDFWKEKPLHLPAPVVDERRPHV